MVLFWPVSDIKILNLSLTIGRIMRKSILRYLSAVAISSMLGCVSAANTPTDKAPNRPLYGEIVVLSFLDREQATSTLAEWERQNLSYEIRSYDTEIETGVFVFSMPEHPYRFLLQEVESGRVLAFDFPRKPKIEWIE